MSNNNIIIDDIEDEYGIDMNEDNLNEYEEEIEYNEEDNDIFDDEEVQEENEEK